jgi:hypothetical protein
VNGAARLAAALSAEGGLLAAALSGVAAAEDPLVDGAAAGPGAERAPAEYALALAAVREAYLLHYAAGCVLRCDDADLALLGGDRLYALALDRLAALGDLHAVAQLAELISRCAEAHAEGRSDLADTAWRAAAAAIGAGGEALPVR